MGRLNEPVQKQCPDGAEYILLSEVVKSISTGKLNVNAMDEGVLTLSMRLA